MEQSLANKISVKNAAMSSREDIRKLFKAFGEIKKITYDKVTREHLVEFTSDQPVKEILSEPNNQRIQLNGKSIVIGKPSSEVLEENSYKRTEDFYRHFLNDYKRFYNLNKRQKVKKVVYKEDQAVRQTKRIRSVNINKMLTKANMSYIDGDNAKAIETLYEIIKVSPSNYEAFRLLSIVYEAEQDNEKALNMLMLSAQVSKQDKDIWVRCAALNKKLGNLTQADYCITRAIRLSKGNFDLVLEKAHLQEETGNLKKAAEIYSRLQGSEHWGYDLILHIINLYEKSSSPGKAIEFIMSLLRKEISGEHFYDLVGLLFNLSVHYNLKLEEVILFLNDCDPGFQLSKDLKQFYSNMLKLSLLYQSYYASRDKNLRNSYLLVLNEALSQFRSLVDAISQSSGENAEGADKFKGVLLACAKSLQLSSEKHIIMETEIKQRLRTELQCLSKYSTMDFITNCFNCEYNILAEEESKPRESPLRNNYYEFEYEQDDPNGFLLDQFINNEYYAEDNLQLADGASTKQAADVKLLECNLLSNHLGKRKANKKFLGRKRIRIRYRKLEVRQSDLNEDIQILKSSLHQNKSHYNLVQSMFDSQCMSDLQTRLESLSVVTQIEFSIQELKNRILLYYIRNYKQSNSLETLNKKTPSFETIHDVQQEPINSLFLNRKLKQTPQNKNKIKAAFDLTESHLANDLMSIEKYMPFKCLVKIVNCSLTELIALLPKEIGGYDEDGLAIMSAKDVLSNLFLLDGFYHHYELGFNTYLLAIILNLRTSHHNEAFHLIRNFMWRYKLQENYFIWSALWQCTQFNDSCNVNRPLFYKMTKKVLLASNDYLNMIMANCYMRNGSYDLCINILSELSKKYNKSSVIRFMLGIGNLFKTLSRNNRRKKESLNSALESMKKYFLLGSQSQDLLIYNCGRFFQFLKIDRLAVEHYERILGDKYQRKPSDRAEDRAFLFSAYNLSLIYKSNGLGKYAHELIMDNITI